MLIDVHNHVSPNEYSEILLAHGKFPKVTKLNDKMDLMIEYGGVSKMKLDREVYDTDNVIAAMDKSGIDASLISCTMPGSYTLDDEYVTKASQVTNDAIAGYCEKYKGRFFGVASLPWRLTEDAIKEADRAKAMGFKAVQQHTQVGDMPVEDDVIQPVYAHCEKIGMPMFLHPCVPTWYEHVKGYHMTAIICFQLDSSIALLRLILSGTLERYPNLRVIMPHAGGVLPYLEGRINYFTEVRKQGCDNITVPFKEQMRNRNIWYDIVSPSVETLGFLKNYVSVDRIMFGTDYPFVAGHVFVDLINKLGYSKDELDKIMWKNANEFFGLGL